MTRPAFRRDGEEGDVLFAGQEQKTQRGVRMAQTAFLAYPLMERKNGRFTWEPSVLCSAFVIPAEAGKSSCPENDFLLLLFF